MWILPRRRCSGAAGGLFLFVLAASASPFAGCSHSGTSTDFALKLKPDSSCVSAPVACVRRLDVELLALDGAPMQSWQLPFTIAGAPAGLGHLPTRGQGRFRVVGVATATGPVTVFTGTSGSVTFDPKNDQTVDVPVACLAIADPCATGTATPSPTPTPPFFVSGTAANLVLGQTNFTNCGDVPGGSTPIQLRESDGIFTDGGKRLYIADVMNGRIQVWTDRTVLTNGAPSTFVIGHGDNTIRNSGGSASNRLDHPRDVLNIPGQGLFLADTNNNRGPIFTPTPVTDNAAATFALGQSNSGNSNGNTAVNGLRGPWGVAWSSSAGLFVSDASNNRVLAYGTNSATYLTDSAAATRVFGQPSFTVNNANHGAAVDGTGFDMPLHLAIDGKRLYVVDFNNNRVLVWNDIRTAVSGQSADFAIGQPNLTTRTAGLTAPSYLNTPRGVIATNGRLAIADAGNNRVLLWQPPPNASTDMPTQVLGQADFTTRTVNFGGGGGGCPPVGVGGSCPGSGLAATASSLSRPGSVWLDGNDLWVADTCNYRAIRFTAKP